MRVNGHVVENPDQWIDFERDRILFDGKPLRAKERVYILLYKPTGYITTFKDPEGRADGLRPDRGCRDVCSPVGRLDLDTSGLLILTNDTQFAERLTNPDHKIAKTYLVKCADLIPDEALERLRRGVELSDGTDASGGGEAGARFGQVFAYRDSDHRRAQPAGAAHDRGDRQQGVEAGADGDRADRDWRVEDRDVAAARGAGDRGAQRVSKTRVELRSMHRVHA